MSIARNTLNQAYAPVKKPYLELQAAARPFDGDGFADQCESPEQCPCSPVNDADLPQDHDHICGYCDGTLSEWCAQECGGPFLKQKDNCPGVDNDDQSNWNEEVERVRDHRVLGGPETFVIGKGDTIPSVERQVDVDTEYRACVDVFPSVDCSLDEQVANYFLRNSDHLDNETQLSVWHRVSIDGAEPGSATNGSNWNPFHAGVPYVSGEITELTWNWKDDYQRWSQSWGANAVPAQPSAPGEGVARFWVHGRTNVGESEDPYGFGLHPIPPDNSGISPDDHSRLANSYGTVEPVAEVTGSAGAFDCLNYLWQFFFGQYPDGVEIRDRVLQARGGLVSQSDLMVEEVVKSANQTMVCGSGGQNQSTGSHRCQRIR